MASEADARLAVDSLNGLKHEGRELKVTLSQAAHAHARSQLDENLDWEKNISEHNKDVEIANWESSVKKKLV